MVFREERFDVEMPRYQDFDVLVRVAKKFKIFYMDIALVDYYIMNDSITKSNDKLKIAFDRILDKYSDFLSVYDSYECLANDSIAAAKLSESKQQRNCFIRYALRFSKSLRIIVKSILVYFRIL